MVSVPYDDLWYLASMVGNRLHPIHILRGIGRRAERLEAQRERKARLAKAEAWLRQNQPPYRVNVGCGYAPFEGWVNLDLNRESGANIVWDISDGLPFGDETCAFIYSEHFLEHLPLQTGMHFLQECNRALMKCGVVRIGMPCMEQAVLAYQQNNWAEQAWIQKFNYGWIRTRAEFLNIVFRDWEHQWLYDREELDRRLRDSGFLRIENPPWGESSYPELRNRETRPETALIAEAAKSYGSTEKGN